MLALSPRGRILRLETLAEQFQARCCRFSDFVAAFRAALDPPPAEVVALKSIAAYRSGLAIEPVPLGLAEQRFLALQHDSTGGVPSV